MCKIIMAKEIKLEKFIEVDGVKYYPVIGMEIHAEMKTNTKMWCACKNEPEEVILRIISLE